MDIKKIEKLVMDIWQKWQNKQNEHDDKFMKWFRKCEEEREPYISREHQEKLAPKIRIPRINDQSNNM